MASGFGGLTASDALSFPPSFGTLPAQPPRSFYTEDFASAADAVEQLSCLSAPLPPSSSTMAPVPAQQAPLSALHPVAMTSPAQQHPVPWAVSHPAVALPQSVHSTSSASGPFSTSSIPQIPVTSQSMLSSSLVSASEVDQAALAAFTQELIAEDDVWSPLGSSSEAGLSPADISSSSTPSPSASSAASSDPPSKRARSTGTMRLQLHVRGFKQILPITLDCAFPIAEARKRILEAQTVHPRAILPDEYDRVVLLTKKPSTMNTTCKYELEDTIQDLPNSTIGDYAGVTSIYIYLACPEPALSNEAGVHRRLAKRDVGVCEAHREKLGRSRKTGKKVALVVPGIRARVIANAGSNVGVKDAKQIQKLWMEQVPTFLKSFLEEHGLQLQQVRFTNSTQGSIVFDMEFVFEPADPLAPATEVSEAQVLGLQRRFAAWLQAKTAGAAPFRAFQPLELDYMRMDVDQLEPQLDVSPLDAAKMEAGLAAVFTVLEPRMATEAGHAEAICAAEARLRHFQHAQHIANSLPLSSKEKHILRKSLDLISGGFTVPRSSEGLASLHTALDVQRCAIARMMTEVCASMGLQRLFLYSDISIGVVEGAFITEQLQRLPMATCGKVTGAETSLSVQLHSPLFRDAAGRDVRFSVWPTERRVEESDELFEPSMPFVRMQQQQLANLANSLLAHLGLSHVVKPQEIALYAVYEDEFDYNSEMAKLTSGCNPNAPDYEPPTKSDLEGLSERLPEAGTYGILFAQPSATARRRRVSQEFR
eukprot:m.285358 g.285358  ORF g.285358 m.285358 type:complete len:764 (+) comp11361_c0_seq1:211-2502(+)